MKQKITHYIRAGYPGLYLVSPEEQRVEAELTAIARELEFQLFAWSMTTGMVDTNKGTIRDCPDPLEVLAAFQELPEKSILMLRDFHLFLGPDPNPVLVRQLKDVLQEGKTKGKTLVLIGCRLVLPPELERELTILEFALPGTDELNRVLDGIVESASLAVLTGPDRENVLNAALGLTTIEAENAFALSVVETGRVEPAIIAREKAQAVKKNGLLEIIESRESLESIGGLDILKDWLLKRRNAFGERARTYGLPAPKGLLIIGLPGTGKSLSAKATAGVFGIPLLRLDAGRIFGGLLGQTESNLRSVIQTAEAIAPCCLWIEELDKAFSGSKKLRIYGWRDFGPGLWIVSHLDARKERASVRRCHGQ